MIHLPLLPVLIPLVAGILVLGAHRLGLIAVRRIALGATVLLALASAGLLIATLDGTVAVVALGNWVAPFGIVFVADRLSATMVAVTAAVAVPALLTATGGADAAGRHFHAFFQFQLAGLNGAFLTGDLFNLFVFFEVLLIASYGLLMHGGGGAARARAGMHYVIVNLAGSALFLIALGLLYGSLGTLNLADVAQRLPQVPPADAALVRTALALLVVVFLLKAAVLPLGLWLQHAYPVAPAPVAALFAVLTKVGFYALLRVSAAAFETTPVATGLFADWLAPVALGTMALGMAGVLAATRLAGITSNLILLSSGVLMAALALGGPAMIAAALYYLPHTTLITAALFLLGGRIAALRGALEDRIERGPRMPRAGPLGAVFLLLAVAASGLPPLSGFLGKAMLMAAAPPTTAGYAYWALLLLSGFVPTLVMARAASTLFWEPRDAGAPAPRRPADQALARGAVALGIALVAVPLLVVAAAPIAANARATAEQLAARAPYLQAVLPAERDVERMVRP